MLRKNIAGQDLLKNLISLNLIWYTLYNNIPLSIPNKAPNKISKV